MEQQVGEQGLLLHPRPQLELLPALLARQLPPGVQAQEDLNTVRVRPVVHDQQGRSRLRQEGQSGSSLILPTT